MNIEQLVTELEQQKSSIDRAISALREVSDSPSYEERPFNASTLTNPQKHSVSTSPDRQATRTGTKKRPPKRKMPVYTDEFRRKVVATVRAGKTLGEAARNFGVTWFSVREWVNSRRFEPQKTDSKKVAAKKSITPKRGTAATSSVKARKKQETTL